MHCLKKPFLLQCFSGFGGPERQVDFGRKATLRVGTGTLRFVLLGVCCTIVLEPMANAPVVVSFYFSP